ncbi:hypothetical protein [Tepidibacter hydrothermalis]|uniref:Uncharacterized protein n=1 Tax=Tepidibacter hydrothermalis TaxID=3036126 RepID=A0ABY8EFX5_9FIRM|nr:hypothetical protein [Tepidibacter hydrothermalis]WFD09750.1 hypothetical protein P4S50_15335 [Tepidibacter hydrothermalis]
MVIEKYKRHDWSKLQEEFIEGDYETLKEFAMAKGLNYKSSQFFVSTKGWLKIKEIVRLNPRLIDTYRLCFNRLLEKMPNRFFTSDEDIWINAALTYICDKRIKGCTLKDISKWYGLNYELVKRKSSIQGWEKYRMQEKKYGFGLYEFIQNRSDDNKC